MNRRSGSAENKLICNNCFCPLTGIKTEKGIVRVRCSYCGVVTTASVKSRRVVQMELIAPEGQEVRW